MSNLLLLLACLLAGMALRLWNRAPDNGHLALNAVIIHVSLPAVTLRYLHGFDIGASHLLPVVMPWAFFAFGALLFHAAGRAMRLPRASVGALTLVGGLGNTSFIGLPMIETLHGRDGLGLGLLIDQLGSYLVLSTLGVLAAAFYASERRVSPSTMLHKVATFPPFIAMVAALLLAPVHFPPAVDAALARLGETVAPLALISVGLQLRFDALRQNLRLLGLGLGYKLMVCPAIVVVVLWLQDAAPAMVSRVSVIEAAMPPMIGAGVVAAQARLDAPLVSVMLGVGIPLGMVSAVLWLRVFERMSL
ncbi:AEC family transporter [Piscinibacter sp. XHJ-5]|uniref:AEC family transporter n=1 Tax=Piscinibacter sp. XHJ-5 TaxID=3037797 RepID=UPI002452880E|nr:AEC family transporter [Piscinibacter sp. XHJ-5]